MNKQTHTSLEIANVFIALAERDGRTLSIMQLLKLVYIAHGFSLAILNKPLIEDRIEAWKHGPVIPKIYNFFRGVFRNHSIDVAFYAAGQDGKVLMPDLTVEESNLISQVYLKYGSLSAFRLSDLTHQPGGPWEQASKRGYYEKMTDAEIKQHYSEIVSDGYGN